MRVVCVPCSNYPTRTHDCHTSESELPALEAWRIGVVLSERSMMLDLGMSPLGREMMCRSSMGVNDAWVRSSRSF